MKKFITLALALLVSACSSHYQSVTAVDDIAYLQLNGNFIGAQLVLDNAPAISLAKKNIKTFTIDSKLTAKFPVTKGTHQLKIMRQGTVIVQRKFYISAGQSFEVMVP